MQHHHHLATSQAAAQRQHRRAVAGKAKLAAVSEPVHQRMEIPEVFQFRTRAVFASGLLQCPLQRRHLRRQHQPLAPGGAQLLRVALVTPLKIPGWRDLQPALPLKNSEVQRLAPLFHLLAQLFEGPVDVGPERREQAEGFALLHLRLGRRWRVVRVAAACPGAKQLLKQTVTTALFQIGPRIGIHLVFHGIHPPPLKGFAQHLLFLCRIELPQKNGWIADVALGLLVFRF